MRGRELNKVCATLIAFEGVAAVALLLFFIAAVALILFFFYTTVAELLSFSTAVAYLSVRFRWGWWRRCRPRKKDYRGVQGSTIRAYTSSSEVQSRQDKNRRSNTPNGRQMAVCFCFR